MFKSRKRLVIAIVVGLLVLAGAYLFLRKDDPPYVQDGINFAPPTEQEKQEAEEHKKEVEKQIEIENQPQPGGKKAVTPAISYAGQYGDVIEVSSFVPGIFEDGGTCTVKLTQGSSVITRDVTGVKDATTTRCPVASVPRSELPSGGTWQATVTYSSNSAEGTSGASSFEVQ
jgi:hypothetical protein